MAYYYDPLEMLASVLQQEYNAGRISYDESIGRLKRTEGSCQFCVNNLWQFTEGCPYGKEILPAPDDGELEAVAQQILTIP